MTMKLNCGFIVADGELYEVQHKHYEHGAFLIYLEGEIDK